MAEVSAIAKPSVKVIVAGLPRTGTASLKKALEMLGYGPVFHLIDPPTQFGRIKLGAECLHTEDKYLRQLKLAQLYHGFGAICDQPGSTVLPDLMEIYPDAKIILTERESAEMWLDSWHGIGIDVRAWYWRVIGHFMPGVLSSSDLITGWLNTASKRFDIPAEASVELYHKHGQWVRDIVPEDKLLVYRHKMGWEELCKHLGRPIPKDENGPAPFPRTNDRSIIKNLKVTAISLGAASYTIVMLIAIVIYFVMTLSRGVETPSVDLIKASAPVALASIPKLAFINEVSR